MCIRDSSYSFIKSNSRIINKRSSNIVKLNLVPDINHINHVIDGLNNIPSSIWLTDEQIAQAATEVSRYSQVDKTGVIGFLASGIEQAIDLVHTVLKGAGLEYTYGIAIITLTCLIKAATLPLTTKQLESTTKMQKLTPLQQKIQAKYANDEQTKNQMLSQLFQTAQVNPLAGCFPALVQIPIFISLYRALLNLVAENKLDEPFLWIPDLEGPVYQKPPGESLDWLKSIISGNPDLGWSDTIAFMSLPLILYVSQTISMKILQPKKDPNRIMTEQEQFSQGLVNNLPFIVAFFSLNVPAGLSIYWIVNNVLTTVITVLVKKQYENDTLPVEVDQMMALIDSPVKSNNNGPKVSMGKQELRMADDRSKKTSGFGTPVDIIDSEIAKSKSNSSLLDKLDADDFATDNGENDKNLDITNKTFPPTKPVDVPPTFASSPLLEKLDSDDFGDDRKKNDGKGKKSKKSRK